MHHLETLRFELHADQCSGFEVVFHHQRGARARQRLDTGGARHFGRRECPFLRRPERQPDRETGALAHGTFHRHRAAVQFGEEFHHGQTESRALVLPRQATVDLTEGLEQVLQPLRRDADAAVGDADLEKFRKLIVGQREAPARPGAGRLADFGARDAAGAQGHLAALVGELDRIRQQVVHDLLDLARVRLNRAQFLGGIHAQADAPGHGLLPDDGQAVPQQRRHLHRFQVERHLAGFHLGQVEDVVDQGEQMLAAAEDVADEPSLLIGHHAHQTVPEHLGEAHDGIEGRPQFV